jgi:MFS family permease
LAIGNLLGRIGYGWLGDRFDKRRIAASGTALMGLGLLFIIYGGAIDQWLILPAAIIFGFGSGGTLTTQSVLLREYFGTYNLGFIIGFSVGITRIGIMIGPPLASWIYEYLGDYHIAWFILISVALISIVSQLTNPSANVIRQRRAG